MTVSIQFGKCFHIFLNIKPRHFCKISKTHCNSFGNPHWDILSLDLFRLDSKQPIRHHMWVVNGSQVQPFIT